MDISSFNEKWTAIPGCGCWIWIAARNRQGYGLVRFGKTMRRAHRVSWEISRGALTDTDQVLHKCDTPSCVNPDHLFIGGPVENMMDRDSKGRHVPHKGESNYFAVLDEKAVIAIRRATGPQRKIASQFGVSQMTVSDIRRRKTWKHLP